jgi:hypothetical protein
LYEALGLSTITVSCHCLPDDECDIKLAVCDNVPKIKTALALPSSTCLLRGCIKYHYIKFLSLDSMSSYPRETFENDSLQTAGYTHQPGPRSNQHGSLLSLLRSRVSKLWLQATTTLSRRAPPVPYGADSWQVSPSYDYPHPRYPPVRAEAAVCR